MGRQLRSNAERALQFRGGEAEGPCLASSVAAPAALSRNTSPVRIRAAPEAMAPNAWTPSRQGVGIGTPGTPAPPRRPVGGHPPNMLSRCPSASETFASARGEYPAYSACVHLCQIPSQEYCAANCTCIDGQNCPFVIGPSLAPCGSSSPLLCSSRIVTR